MELEPSQAEREMEARASALLAAEAGAVTALAELEPAAARRLVLAVQRVLLGGGAGGSVAARLAVARASPSLLLAAEASRHLRGLLDRRAGAALPPGEAAALERGERLGAVARADAADAPRARLTRTAGGWRLTARKGFVSNAPLADWIGVFAEADGREALCLLAPGDAGVRVGPRLALMGLDGLHVAPVAADDAPVPEERVLGPLVSPAGGGDGEEGAAGACYDREADLTLAVAAAGLMRGVLSAAQRHARAHLRDGRPVFTRQEVAFKLAEVLAQADAAELLCHRAAWLSATNDPQAPALVRCAKVFCAESAERAASACLQVMAGEGYRRGSPAERAYRDAKGLALAGTTVEVARMAIADGLLARG